MLDRFSLVHGVFQVIRLTAQYLQLKFDNYEHNWSTSGTSGEILQKKTLYQVSFDHEFLEIY